MAVKRNKAPALARVPQSRTETADAIGRIGALQRQLRWIETEMNEKLAGVRGAYEADAAPLADEVKALSAGVHTWCEANREALAGKSKTGHFTTGEVTWRLTPPRVAIPTRRVEIVMAKLRELGLHRFIRTKEEINREAILADPDAVGAVGDIAVKQTEEFAIEPFETPLAAAGG